MAQIEARTEGYGSKVYPEAMTVIRDAQLVANQGELSSEAKMLWDAAIAACELLEKALGQVGGGDRFVVAIRANDNKEWPQVSIDMAVHQ